MMSALRLTLGGAAEAGVSARLGFGSLPVQDVLNQILDAEVSGTKRTLDAVD